MRFRRFCLRAREWYAEKSRQYHAADAVFDDSTPPHPIWYGVFWFLVTGGLVWSGYGLFFL